MKATSLPSGLVSVLVGVCVAASAADYYVSLTGGHVPPFSTWANAATNIQDAIDAASAGDTVWVTNGVYNSGGRVAPGAVLTNRVLINKALTVRSVNGPGNTVIQGYQVPGPIYGVPAVRCVWLEDGATLSGFNLNGGATIQAAGGLNGTGGGAYCNGANAVLTNCIITGNAASGSGGGVYQGTIRTSQIISNISGTGGGVYNCKVFDSSLLSNQANSGGGSYGSASGFLASNCIFSANSVTIFGGGAYQTTLINCFLTNNSAATSGGGAYLGGLLNCQVVGNTANSSGGGVFNAALTNCFVGFNQVTNTSGAGGGAYYNSPTAMVWNSTLVRNSARLVGGIFGGKAINSLVYFNSSKTETPNYSGTVMTNCCTTPLPGSGSINVITADPQLFSDGIHLMSSSQCIERGTNLNVSGRDIDGQSWANPPSIGCDEWNPAPLLLTQPRILPGRTNGQAVVRAEVAGETPYCWWTKDGAPVQNGPQYDAANSPKLYISNFNVGDGGSYQVVASNNFGMVTSTVVQVMLACVDVNSGSPAAPYTDWYTAATTIQDAVDALGPNGVVLVTNGNYFVGGRFVTDDMTNRVVLDKPVTVLSVNGPEQTVIAGAWDPVSTNGPGSVRCVWVGEGAVIAGFTLKDGSAANGAGAYSVDPGLRETVVNCILTNNRAVTGGGGAFQGRLRQCELIGNTAANGGGAASAFLANSVLKTNSASNGGGSYQANLNDCVVFWNTAVNGGGLFGGLATRCTIASNTATSGGGVYKGQASSSRLLNNSGNGAMGSWLQGCFLRGNSPYGSSSSTNLNCTFVENASALSGGASTNCLVWFNEGSSSGSITFLSGGAQPGDIATLQPGSVVRQYPNFLGDGIHLAADSPVRGRGRSMPADVLDIDGQPFGSPPSIGCDEWTPEPLLVAQPRIVPGTSPGVAVLLAEIAGAVVTCGWTKDAAPIINNNHFAGASTSSLVISNFNVADTGAYQVVASNAFGVVTSAVVQVNVACVDAASSSPVSPYTNWSNAAMTIQEAVDAAPPGTVVLVTNGTYGLGGRPAADGVTNRVVVDKPITLLGLSGPNATLITGAWDPVTTNGLASVRCLWLHKDAVIGGFTLLNGSSSTNGGGLWCEGLGLRENLVGCVITNCRSAGYGGGAYQGRLRQSRISGNASQSRGGGAAFSFVDVGMVEQNSATDGGGLFSGIARRCQVVSNTAARFGGGVAGEHFPYPLVTESAIASNTASNNAGAYFSTLFHCTVVSNLSTAGSVGGIQFGEAWNSICYYNASTTNWPFTDAGGSAAIFNLCTTRSTATSVLTNNPQLLDLFHIAANSPCRGAGTNLASGLDLDGEPWLNPPSIGCDEVWESAITGPLGVTISSSLPAIAERGLATLTGTVSGRASRLSWDYGDGSILTNQSVFVTSHVWTNAGNYNVSFTAYNADYPGGVSTNLTLQVVPLVSPQIESPVAGSNNFTLSFQGQPGVRYYIEQTTNLVPPVIWTTVQSPRSTGQVMQVTDTSATNDMRFYRVRVP